MRHKILVGASLLLWVAACSDGDRPSPTPGVTQVREETSMRLTSTAFEHEGDIPERYSCDGIDVSPSLAIDELPAGAVSLVLVMDDPDAPRGTWDHWVAYDIEPAVAIPEGVGGLGTAGTNSWGRTGYGGPCPPGGTHRYYFRVYALDSMLGLDPGARKAEVLEALEGHVLAEATLMGRFSRG